MISLIFTVVLIGVMIYVFMLDGDKSKIPTKDAIKKGKDKKTSSSKNFGKNMYSTQDRINIKKIKSIGDGDDGSLIVKNDDSYVGVIEVYGVNYNLLSTRERLVLEEVFQTMINGLDYPIQLFIQSRRIDIENYNNIYEKRLEELSENLKQERNKLALQSANPYMHEEILDIENNIIRLENQIEYGKQVVEFINNFASYSNILEKRYYIAIPYRYTGDIKDENEKFITAYNTIANRANSIIAALSRGNLTGKFLNGYELSELLYVAYNKKDSGKYKFDRALMSGFSNFIVTSRPVEFKILEEKEKELDELIGV